jgi:hypothetical protein
MRAAPDYADAMFNLALLLQRGNKHAEGAEYWLRYLAAQNDQLIAQTGYAYRRPICFVRHSWRCDVHFERRGSCFCGESWETHAYHWLERQFDRLPRSCLTSCRRDIVGSARVGNDPLWQVSPTGVLAGCAP